MGLAAWINVNSLLNSSCGFTNPKVSCLLACAGALPLSWGLWLAYRDLWRRGARTDRADPFSRSIPVAPIRKIGA